MPEAGIEWSGIDDSTTLATLTDRGRSVSLKFRFNDTRQVTGIYCPGRHAMLGKGFELMPWEKASKNID